MATQQTQSQSPNYGTNRQNSPWEKLLTQMMMAQRMDSKTMAGFALGQILSGLLRNWKTNYDKRGEIRREWEDLTPEERTAKLAEIEAKDPSLANERRKFVTDRWGEGAFAPTQTPAQTQGAPVQPPAQPPLQQQAAPQTANPIRAALNAEMSKPQLLGSEADWQRTLEELARRRMQLGGAQYAF